MKLQTNSLIKEFQGRQILNKVTFAIELRDSIGLVGINGSGKTTILKLLAGLEIPTSGEIIKVPNDLKIGYVPQITDFPNDKNITEGLAISLNLENDEIWKIHIALHELGIGNLALRSFKTLSSGQKTKVYLARLLIQKPDILLLDEPTNHLDIESLEWLETYLKNYQGAFLTVSHDRRFLDNTVTKILELDNGEIKIYGGNYSFYRQQKQIERQSQLRNYISQEKKNNRIFDRVRVIKDKTQQLEVRTSGADHFVRKKAAKAASKAKSTEKMLIKQLAENGIEKPQKNIDLSVIFRPQRESSQTLIFLDKVSKNFGRHQVLKDFSLVIEKGDKIALIGSNGSGKSTLINLILDKISQTVGKIEIGNNVDIGYLPQEQSLIDSDLNPIEYLVNSCHLDRTSAYKLAKRFLFTSEDLKTPANKLSSGQISKLRLATIMASGSNFIILDEPTNYLDIPSREALEEALVSYTGTLLVVSHDRYFLDRINPTKIINLESIS